jgi:hypothetical protein
MITYAITVADEDFEFKRLINALQPYLLKDEEIVVLADSNKVTKSIRLHAELCNIKINYFDFQNNFADFKNELFNLSSKKYLFQIDADEQIPITLIHALRSIAKSGEVETLWIPRINVVQGASQEMGWQGFPDYQCRFVKNEPHIRWKGKVHETLVGSKNQKIMNTQPAEFVSILHVKHIEKQIAQNLFYDKI